MSKSMIGTAARGRRATVGHIAAEARAISDPPPIFVPGGLPKW